jgi:hypothetical protein
MRTTIAVLTLLGVLSVCVEPSRGQNLGREVEDQRKRIEALQAKMQQLEAGLATPAAPSVPKGAVVPFTAPQCPEGWQEYKRGQGRVILGSGVGITGTGRDVGSTGGGESQRLTIGQMPAHDHGMRGAADGTRLSNVDMAKPQYAVGWSYQSAGKFNWSQGQGEPFSTMPPFVALLLCEKQ